MEVTLQKKVCSCGWGSSNQVSVCMDTRGRTHIGISGYFLEHNQDDYISFDIVYPFIIFFECELTSFSQNKLRSLYM